MLAHVTPVPFEALDNPRIIRVTRPVARIHHNVRRGKFMLMQSERLADQPLDTVATYGVADSPRSNGQTQASQASSTGTSEDGEQGIGGTFRVTINAIEFGLVMETLRRSERPGECLQAGSVIERQSEATTP